MRSTLSYLAWTHLALLLSFHVKSGNAFAYAVISGGAQAKPYSSVMEGDFCREKVPQTSGERYIDQFGIVNWNGSYQARAIVFYTNTLCSPGSAAVIVRLFDNPYAIQYIDLSGPNIPNNLKSYRTVKIEEADRQGSRYIEELQRMEQGTIYVPKLPSDGQQSSYCSGSVVIPPWSAGYDLSSEFSGAWDVYKQALVALKVAFRALKSNPERTKDVLGLDRKELPYYNEMGAQGLDLTVPKRISIPGGLTLQQCMALVAGQGIPNMHNFIEGPAQTGIIPEIPPNQDYESNEPRITKKMKGGVKNKIGETVGLINNNDNIWTNQPQINTKTVNILRDMIEKYSHPKLPKQRTGKHLTEKHPLRAEIRYLTSEEQEIGPEEDVQLLNDQYGQVSNRQQETFPGIRNQYYGNERDQEMRKTVPKKQMVPSFEDIRTESMIPNQIFMNPGFDQSLEPTADQFKTYWDFQRARMPDYKYLNNYNPFVKMKPRPEGLVKGDVKNADRKFNAMGMARKLPIERKGKPTGTSITRDEVLGNLPIRNELQKRPTAEKAADLAIYSGHDRFYSSKIDEEELRVDLEEMEKSVRQNQASDWVEDFWKETSNEEPDGFLGEKF
ncbi:hypothetical protein H072_10296 [Dactylellina haptotyla CBS 200.50]|uniref:Enterotoxin n=1 Tax=Dactylellina haptotyla (strain CBS 200.50) TaxID=1284197 RepID=S8BLY5_DACHA|nr:hypothetical protein H072_10296 [Dactylellina haptotyla CBS 200.50]